jgi:lactate racemase
VKLLTVEDIWLQYGKKKIGIKLDSSRIVDFLNPNDINTNRSEEEIISNAVDNPISSPSISELFVTGDLVTILVNDLTRLVRTEVFLPIIIEKLLEAGVRKKDINILFATGAHRKQTKEEQISIVGKIPDEINLQDHICTDKDSLKYLGTTMMGTPIEVNKMICPPYKTILTGEIGYHLFAGYSGGRKSIIPGVASFKTTQINHSLMLLPESHAGSLEDNPLSKDMVEGASLIKPTFIVNVILDDKKRIIRVFCGDFLEAHRQGCHELDNLYSTKIKKKSDIVVGSCGGYPKDINFYQAHKVLENIARIARDGGVVILFAECIEGIGSSSFRRGMTDYPDLEAIKNRIYNDFELGMHKAFFLRRLLKRVKVMLISELLKEDAKVMGVTLIADFDTALKEAEEITGKDSGISVVTDGSITWPFVY